MAEIGHNNALTKGARDKLKSYVERIENIQDERKSLGEDITELFQEAKSEGFDVKALRKIIALRKIDAATREEQDAILDTYKHALGMTPLEEAIARTGPDDTAGAAPPKVDTANAPFHPPADDLEIPASLRRY